MKVQFDQNGFQAQMGNEDASISGASILKENAQIAKSHTALVLGVLALLLILCMIPFMFAMDIATDITELFLTEGFESAQELDEALENAGIFLGVGELAYTMLTTINPYRFLFAMGVIGMVVLLLVVALAVLAIVSYAKKPRASTATAGLVLAILSLVACLFVITSGVLIL